MSDLPAAPPVEPSDTPTQPEVDVQRLQAVTGILNSKNPALGLVALLLVGGGGGALSGAFISPYISEAVEEHEDDPRAHPELVARLERLEEKVDDLDDDLEKSSTTLSDISKGVAVMRARLEVPR